MFALSLLGEEDQEVQTDMTDTLIGTDIETRIETETVIGTGRDTEKTGMETEGVVAGRGHPT